MNERICLITGATDGVGKATALALALKGYKVVIAGRNSDKLKDVIKEISGIYKDAALDSIQGDLSDLRQVKNMIATFKKRYHRLDLLINNAGMVSPRLKMTGDGFETTFQVNYLAPFILTNALLPLIENSDDGRVINLASDVYSMSKFDLAGTADNRKYSAIRAYAASKLYVVMFTEELAKRTEGRILVNAIHPGVVKTNMSMQLDGFPLLFRIISAVAMPFAISPEKAAETVISLTGDDSASHVSGGYFTSSGIKKVKHKSDTPANRLALWDYSMKAGE